MIYKNVGVGIALILMDKVSNVLLGKRAGERHGVGDYGFPGGKLELHEKGYAGALRELREETGLTRRNIELIDRKPCALTEDEFPEDGLHFITMYFRAKYLRGIPKVMEPKHCEEWRWSPWKRLPSKLFLPVRNLVNQGYNPFTH